MKRIILATALASCFVVPAIAQRVVAPAGPPNPYQGNSDAIGQGQQLYNQNCTACHGANGEAGEMAPALVLNMSMALKGGLNDNQLLNVIRNGVPGTLMPAWQTKLSDDDILKIGIYLQSLRGTAIDNPSPGNVAHGEEVFWGKGQCGMCHAVNGRGAFIGPDLTSIANVRKTTSLIDALTKAQHRIYSDGGAHLKALPVMDTYDLVHITLTNGKTLDGVMLNQDSYSVQMRSKDDQLHLLDRANIRKISTMPPLMPTDYNKRLTPDEFKDLLAYVTRLGRTAPAAGPAGPSGG